MSTISDVAKLAGVSPGTVSRVMNGATNVNPETRTKVEQAIANLGYQPNLQARSLRNKRTDTIALAIPELTNYFWTTVARGVQDASQSNGYHVLICNPYAKSRQNLLYMESIYNRVDGMILSRRSEWAVLASEEGQTTREKPIVFVGQSQAASWNVDNVYSDSIAGAFALTKHLISLGHSRIAIVTGRQSSTSANDRVVGYCMALNDAKITLDRDLICWGEYERKTAEYLTNELINRQPTTTAIVAANNEIAIGVMQTLEKRKISVPEQIAVVCFDDFYPDSRFATFMTVASQSPYDIGVNATQLLINRLTRDDHFHLQTVVLPVRMIVRHSCGGAVTSVESTTAFDNIQGQLIPPLPREKITELGAGISSLVQVSLPTTEVQPFRPDRSHVALLIQALKNPTAPISMIPHFEYGLTNAPLVRYVLAREPRYEVVNQTRLICAEDQVEFAQRSGIAAIPCRFPFKPDVNLLDSSWDHKSELVPFDFPNLTDHLDLFDGYVRAARNTNVGIAADFRSIVADTLHIAKALSGLYPDAQEMLPKIADSLMYYQIKVIQLICDRFASDLAFVILSDHLADKNGLIVPESVFEDIFLRRLQRLIYPAQEHGLAIALYSMGKVDAVVPIIRKIGFDALYIAEPEVNDLTAIQQAGQGTLAFMGAIPCSLLETGTEQSIIHQAAETIALFAPNGGYVAGLGQVANQDGNLPVKNFFSLLRALSAAR